MIIIIIIIKMTAFIMPAIVPTVCYYRDIKIIVVISLYQVFSIDI